MEGTIIQYSRVITFELMLAVLSVFFLTLWESKDELCLNLHIDYQSVLF